MGGVVCSLHGLCLVLRELLLVFVVSDSHWVKVAGGLSLGRHLGTHDLESLGISVALVGDVAASTA